LEVVVAAAAAEKWETWDYADWTDDGCGITLGMSHTSGVG